MPIDNNYFQVDQALSWKDLAEKIDQEVETSAEDDGLAQIAAERDHGQLAVDIYQTASDVIVIAPIAGVEPDHLDISINDDILTIRGERSRSKYTSSKDLLYQEVHWGSFSRSIILPIDVVNERVDATLKDGILTIRLPKAKSSRSIKVKMED